MGRQLCWADAHTGESEDQKEVGEVNVGMVVDGGRMEERTKRLGGRNERGARGRKRAERDGETVERKGAATRNTRGLKGKEIGNG